MREITIRPALNGYVCAVGCQVVVFDSRVKLIEALSHYLDNPEVTEKRFLEQALNPMKDPCETVGTLGQPCPPPCEQPAQRERNPVLRR